MLLEERVIDEIINLIEDFMVGDASDVIAEEINSHKDVIITKAREKHRKESLTKLIGKTLKKKE